MKRIFIFLSILLFVVYLAFFNHVEYHTVGLAYDRISGKSWIQTPGYYFTNPFTMVNNIDIRPTRVCLTSTGRAYNCKLVSFVPKYYSEFLEIEGFRYYWLSNRLSFNFGYNQEYRGMIDLLRGYSFSTEVNTYRFIRVY